MLLMRNAWVGYFIFCCVLSGSALADFLGIDGNLNFSNWTGLTSNNALSSASASSLSIEICDDHFPTGSQNRTNILAAINAINGIPGVKINMTPVYVPHKYIKMGTPASNTVWVDYVDIAETDPNAPFDVSVGCVSPCASGNDHGKIQWSAKFFSPTPGTKGSISTMAMMNAFSKLFGIIHPKNRTNPALRSFSAMSSWGNPLIHSGDKVLDTLHAWDFYQLRAFYPDPNLGNLATDELAIHTRITMSDPNPVERLFRNENPRRLRWKSSTSSYVSCVSNANPVYTVQWSELSTNTTNKNYKIRYSTSKVVNPVATADWNTLVEDSRGTYPAGQTDPFYQYRWTKTLSITGAKVNVSNPASMVKRKIRITLDPTSVVPERNENNNTIVTTLCLYPESQTTCSEVCNGD